MPARTGHFASSPRARVAFAASVALALVAACTKSESGTPAPETSSAASATAATGASAVPVVETPSPTAGESTTPPEATGHAAAVAKAAADAGHAAAEPPKSSAAKDGGTTPAASGSASPVECGTKPLPDCPLQAWMKAHANPPVMTSDLGALAKVLDEIAQLAPPGYTNWASISKDGAAAARAGDLTAAKASCRTCHDQYKQKYKAELRARKI